MSKRLELYDSIYPLYLSRMFMGLNKYSLRGKPGTLRELTITNYNVIVATISRFLIAIIFILSFQDCLCYSTKVYFISEQFILNSLNSFVYIVNVEIYKKDILKLIEEIVQVDKDINIITGLRISYVSTRRKVVFFLLLGYFSLLSLGTLYASGFLWEKRILATQCVSIYTMEALIIFNEEFHLVYLLIEIQEKMNKVYMLLDNFLERKFDDPLSKKKRDDISRKCINIWNVYGTIRHASLKLNKIYKFQILVKVGISFITILTIFYNVLLFLFLYKSCKGVGIIIVNSGLAFWGFFNFCWVLINVHLFHDIKSKVS